VSKPMDQKKPVWAKQMQESPFARSHFTNELQNEIMRRAGRAKTNRKWITVITSTAILLSVVLIGLSVVWNPKSTDTAFPSDSWQEDKPFVVGDYKMIGKEGKFGLQKMNGEPNEDFAILAKGIHYQIYFWGNPDRFVGNYKLFATHEGTKEVLKLYEWPIAQVTDDTNGSVAQSGGKTSFDEPGLWKLEVYINDIYYDSVVIDVK
jgi:hypothetical protein